MYDMYAFKYGWYVSVCNDTQPDGTLFSGLTFYHHCPQAQLKFLFGPTTPTFSFRLIYIKS